MTACSFAVSAHVCWNWAVRAARTAIPRFIPGRTWSTCRSLGMRRLESIRRTCGPSISRGHFPVRRVFTLWYWGGTPLPPSIAIFDLAANRQLIHGAQSLTGKILGAKELGVEMARAGLQPTLRPAHPWL